MQLSTPRNWRAVQVEWNARLFSAAGRADFRRNLVSLNPRLREHDAAEIDRTLAARAGSFARPIPRGPPPRLRRMEPNGGRHAGTWELATNRAPTRCPFPIQRRSRRFLYECPRCGKEFPRVRRIKRAVACLDCCRKFNRGKFEKSAQLRLVQIAPRASATGRETARMRCPA